MKRVIVGLLVISFSLLIKSCDTTDPPDNKSLNLKLEDVSCTEAWIELTTTNLQLPTTLTLKQTNPTGDTKSKILNLNTKDSLLYIDSLLPNQAYKFNATIQSYSHTSKELSVTTMDTTSHDFAFETFTFGDISNSVLFDVTIINENNIWAVGEINIADTSINGYTTYNAVHWDGSQWELKRILYQGSFWAIRTVFALNENDIWFSAFVRYDGQNFIELPIPPILMGWTINKIWGTSNNDLYFVGEGGNVAHYLNGIWSMIASETDVGLLDVWGTPDDNIVWASGREDGNKTVLIKIENNIANIVFEDQYPWQIKIGRISGGISSIWTNSKNFIYLTTPITAYRCLSTTSGEGKEIYTFYDYLNGGTIRIRGNSGNDIITSGSNCSILHYNGFSWKRYEQFTDINTVLWSSNIKGNILAAVGDKLENLFYYKAIVIVGRR
jgi:hypothetical protein